MIVSYALVMADPAALTLSPTPVRAGITGFSVVAPVGYTAPAIAKPAISASNIRGRIGVVEGRGKSPADSGSGGPTRGPGRKVPAYSVAPLSIIISSKVILGSYRPGPPVSNGVSPRPRRLYTERPGIANVLSGRSKLRGEATRARAGRCLAGAEALRTRSWLRASALGEAGTGCQEETCLMAQRE